MNLPNRPQSEVAALLRDGRVGLALEIDQVSTLTRIPRDRILAIEEGRFSDLPGAPYARAFVRTLSQAYGIDAETALAALRRDLGLPGDPPPAPRPLAEDSGESAARPASGGGKGPAILVGLLAVALLAVLGFTRIQNAPRTPAVDSLAMGSPDDFRDTAPVTGAPEPDTAEDTAATPPRTVSLSLSDSGTTAFVLYIRGAKVRKRIFAGRDSLVLDPDTSGLFRNLSGKSLRLSGAISRDTLGDRYFRLARTGDSVLLETVDENTWKREYGRVVPADRPASGEAR